MNVNIAETVGSLARSYYLHRPQHWTVREIASNALVSLFDADHLLLFAAIHGSSVLFTTSRALLDFIESIRLGHAIHPLQRYVAV